MKAAPRAGGAHAARRNKSHLTQFMTFTARKSWQIVPLWRARNRIFRDALLRKNSIPYPNFLTEPTGGGLGAPMLRKSLMQLSEHEAQLLSGQIAPA